MIFFVFLFSCGKGTKHSYVKVEKSKFLSLVNAKKISPKPNLSLDKTVFNNDYPIEIAFYEDKKFYYNLPRLGDGQGTWYYRNGHLELSAKRKIFDIYIEIHAQDDKAENLLITFTDRFGRKVLKADKDLQ
jgi:hypothetical protein